ncbi:MAG: epoxide hydrolase family protein [Nostoc sp.]|uniref:epoxide hydrolase family protein n=1 Tax=Nostoc sp. TaxID=1180 RepID=UPI002FFB9253
MKNTLIEAAPIAVSEVELKDLQDRLARTRWPEKEPVSGWVQGAPLAKVQALCEYWRDRYNWHRCEMMLNGWNPQRTVIDGCGIHFFHVPSPEPNALPVIMTHGWPGSVIEFHKVIAPLTDPRSQGGDPADAIHLVLPSLPGYGFSEKPNEPGWSLLKIADAWIELMQRLGYGERWAAQGGDWGAQVSAAIGSRQPDGCIGIHLNGIAWKPSEAEIASADTHERQLIERLQRYNNDLSGYNKVQSTRPQTIGYALADSPAGQAAWIYEKFHDWTDNEGDPESIFSMDEMLDNIMIYWITNTGASSARRYWENDRDPSHDLPVKVPFAFSRFPKDIGGSSQRWAKRRFHQIVRWSETSKGGHFAAFEQPALFVEEVRAGLRAVQQKTL